MQQDRNDRAEFSARSVLASLLLGMRRPSLPGAGLVRGATALGVAAGTTRVALSRMVAAGELSLADGVYSLAGPLLERHRRQESGRRPPMRATWDGGWRVAIVGGVARPASARAMVRRTLLGLRLFEFREGVWVRPDNLAVDYPALDECTWWTGARPEDAVDLWDLDGWAGDSEMFIAAMESTPPASDLQGSFILAAAVVRHLRDDPLLPRSMLPEMWPGGALRLKYDSYEYEFETVMRKVLRGRR